MFWTRVEEEMNNDEKVKKIGVKQIQKKMAEKEKHIVDGSVWELMRACVEQTNVCGQ